MLIDNSKGRIAKKLRISLTDRCNLSCLFCMPQKDRIRWIPNAEVLTFEEVEQTTRVLASLGIEKVRITGGEPLLREGVERLVGMIRSISGIRKVDMTTNGLLLAEKAKLLHKAGLHGVTVSLHSLRKDRFAKITGEAVKKMAIANSLPKVLDGIDAACEAGLGAVKINTVAMHGYNDDEIIDIVKFAREKNLSVRFIEFMPLDGLGIWSPNKIMSGKEVLATISRHFNLVPRGRMPGDTASLYGFEDGMGEVGVITPMTTPFCDDCDRIRLSADGKLLTCLFDTNYYDLKPILRMKENHNTDADASTSALTDDAMQQLAKYIVECVLKKPAGVAYMPLIKEIWKKPRSMNAIGG